MTEYTRIKNAIQKRKTKLAKLLLQWSQKNSPEYPWRKTSDPYKIMISEMLLRRTRASNVIPVYKTLIKKFPNIESLQKSSVREIEKIIRSLGIKSRSSKIRSTAQTIARKYPDSFPSEEKELKNVLGSGSNYTINTIRCFAYDQNVPIFDVNVQRIFERIFSIDFGKDAHKKKDSWKTVSYALPQKNVKQFNWALLDLGKEICVHSTPKCEKCPLKTICDYGKDFS